jgi:hypothetical protein
LESIGRVAAAWSLLETAIIVNLSDIADTPPFQTTVLAGPAAFDSWLDMTIILVKTTSHSHKLRELETLFGLMKKLHRLRNYIVHASWDEPNKGRGIIASAMNPVILTPYDKASGFGIPKRGHDVFVQVSWTPQQMRHVSNLIEEARLMLYEIVDHWPQAPQKTLNAPGQKGPTILPRIRQMLDTLPDPFQKSSKQPRGPSAPNPG